MGRKERLKRMKLKMEREAWERGEWFSIGRM